MSNLPAGKSSSRSYTWAMTPEPIHLEALGRVEGGDHAHLLPDHQDLGAALRQRRRPAGNQQHGNHRKEDQRALHDHPPFTCLPVGPWIGNSPRSAAHSGVSDVPPVPVRPARGRLTSRGNGLSHRPKRDGWNDRTACHIGAPAGAPMWRQHRSRVLRLSTGKSERRGRIGRRLGGKRHKAISSAGIRRAYVRRGSGGPGIARRVP